MATLTQPIKWHGGKHYLAQRIIAEMPPRCRNPNKPDPDDKGWLHYVEPFFGGGSVLLAQDPEGVSEVVNDLNENLSIFWTVIQDPHTFSLFRRAVECCPFSNREYSRMTALLEQEWESIPFPQHKIAAAFFVACRQSMSGRMNGFAPLTRNRTRRGMNEQASAWLNAIEGLPAVHERLKRVVILNDYACTVIRQQDGPRTLFYCDPPYMHGTRATTGEYDHEMSDAEHAAFLGVLCGIKGRFILSGYPSDLYRKVARDAGWRCVEIPIDNKASSKKMKDKEVECLWMNY